MDKSLLLNDFSQLLMIDVNQLTDDFILEQHPTWDSLSVVSAVGAIDEHYQISVAGTELMSCVSIGDIFSLIKSKM